MKKTLLTLLSAINLTFATTTANVAIEDFFQSDGATFLSVGSLYEIGFLSSGVWTVFGSNDLDVAGGNAFPSEALTVDNSYTGQLFVRIYDTPDNSGNFNTVTNSNWNAVAGSVATPPSINIFVGAPEEADTVFLDAPAFQVAPEPTTFALAGLGGLALIARRKRA